MSIYIIHNYKQDIFSIIIVIQKQFQVNITKTREIQNELIKNSLYWHKIMMQSLKTKITRYNNFIQDIMYNRHVFERDEKQLLFQRTLYHKLAELKSFHRKSNTDLSKKYKQRVNDFLVQIADSPPKIDHYQPPIKHIIRTPTQDKMICDPQLYINGFKTNRQRIERAISQQKIFDLSPTSKDNSAMLFRPRNPQKQIQSGMKFASKNSKSVVVLPKINPPKMHFKALEQLGNNLKSMQQQQIQMVSLVNRLQTITGPTKANPMQMSITMLQKCKILSKKNLKTA